MQYNPPMPPVDFAELFRQTEEAIAAYHLHITSGYRSRPSRRPDPVPRRSRLELPAFQSKSAEAVRTHNQAARVESLPTFPLFSSGLGVTKVSAGMGPLEEPRIG